MVVVMMMNAGMIGSVLDRAMLARMIMVVRGGQKPATHHVCE